jgi:hypothetical protein
MNSRDWRSGLRRAGGVVTVLALMAVAWPPGAAAKVPPGEAAKLGQELTPLGAIRAGNAEGTIPPWEGGITAVPPDYVPGKHLTDPFASDSIRLTITADNAKEHAGLLSPGQLAMFERYPETWVMHVYPTRRSASNPQHIYDAAIANATTAELTGDGLGVRGATGSSPFPIPQSGLEAIWNHLMRYRGETIVYFAGEAAVTAGGAYTMSMVEIKVLFRLAQAGSTTENVDNVRTYFLYHLVSPPRVAGSLLLVHETIDQVAEPRKAWTYNPGQRRVRRAPQISYDNPSQASDDQRTTDDFDMWNGAPDRYDWELVGRREMYVPYNCYRLHSDALTYDDILHAGHVNPEHVRYELHRVWVIEARVKEGMSHIYARRTMYLDEDSWQILVIDSYDSRGEIWRVSQSHQVNYYTEPTMLTTLDAWYDLQNGRYAVYGLSNEQPESARFDVPLSPQDFTPAALRRIGRR